MGPTDLKGATMPNAGLRALVPPIAGTPLPHGLLGGCVPVVTATDMHHMNGVDLLPQSCAGAHPWVDCPDPATGWTNPDAKIFDRPESCTFEPVTVYSGYECSVIGSTFQEAQANALNALERGEQAALEEHFMTRWLADASHTVDLTPFAGAVHVTSGVGLLETWLATTYGGTGVIHVPVGVASLLTRFSVTEIPREDECARTLAGNSLVLGAGYSANLGPVDDVNDPEPAPADEAWLYITPPMRIRRDDRVIAQTLQARAVDTAVNDLRVLAETTFVPEVACCAAAAVRINLSPCC